jgi:hypothetical protein
MFQEATILSVSLETNSAMTPGNQPEANVPDNGVEGDTCVLCGDASQWPRGQESRPLTGSRVPDRSQGGSKARLQLGRFGVMYIEYSKTHPERALHHSSN